MESRSCSVSSGLLRRSGAAPVLVLLFLLAGLAGALSLGGCAQATARRSSHEPRAAASASQAPKLATAPEAPWDLAADLKLLRTAGERTRSEHFSGDLDAEVLGNDAAAPYATLGPARVLPEGAEIVLVLRASGEPSPKHYLAMRKRAAGFDPEGADWEYAVAAPSGAITERGRISGCRRCHAEAPHDYLFGPARAASTSERP